VQRKLRVRLREGSLIRLFDPWRSPLCTCPLKYSLNPYTGCSHFCLYCYATSYIGVKNSRPKRDYKQRLVRDLARINPRLHIDIATSSDPYPPEEEQYRLTRWTLELLLPRGYRVLVITKSSMVARDADILSRGNAAVTVTVTTLDKSLAARLEPGAPPPSERVKAMKRLVDAGVPVGLRLDPIIPYLNSEREHVEAVIEAAASIGVRFLVTSTYKARPDSLKRLANAFPDLSARLHRLYREEGAWLHGYWYLPLKLRKNMMEAVKKIAEKYGLEFATCREGLQYMHTASTCDGSHLIPLRLKHSDLRRGGDTLDKYL